MDSTAILALVLSVSCTAGGLLIGYSRGYAAAMEKRGTLTRGEPPDRPTAREPIGRHAS
jgi:hypothetical protein